MFTFPSPKLRASVWLIALIAASVAGCVSNDSFQPSALTDPRSEPVTPAAPDSKPAPPPRAPSQNQPPPQRPAPAQDPAEREVAQPHAQPPRVFFQKGRITLGAGAPAPEGVPGSFGVVVTRGLEFPVEANATALFVELVWNGEPSGQDLDLYVFDPDGKTLVKGGGSLGSPDLIAWMRIDSPAPGQWSANAGANGIALQRDFWLYASVFYGIEPPLAYTAARTGDDG